MGVPGLGHRRSFGGSRLQTSPPRFLELAAPPPAVLARVSSRTEAGRLQDDGCPLGLRSNYCRPEAGAAKPASMGTKDDLVFPELEADFIENKGFFEKEASVYAEDVWYLAGQESVYAKPEWYLASHESLYAKGVLYLAGLKSVYAKDVWYFAGQESAFAGPNAAFAGVQAASGHSESALANLPSSPARRVCGGIGGQSAFRELSSRRALDTFGYGQ